MLTLSGRQVVCQGMNGLWCTGTAFTPNVPWQGLIADASGTGFALLAGTGVYIAQDTGGYAEIGVKIR